MEFYKAFSKVLRTKRGQPEAVLQEVTGNCHGLRPSSSSIVQIHIRLLSLIRKDMGEGDPRSWIEQENTKFYEREKEMNEKVVAAKRKVKNPKKKPKVELAKPMVSVRDGAPLSVTKHNDPISKIRTESEKAHAKFLESADLSLKSMFSL